MTMIQDLPPPTPTTVETVTVQAARLTPSPVDAVFSVVKVDEAIATAPRLDEALTIRNTQIAQELALPPVKIHCSILAEDAIKAAVEDYRKKHTELAVEPRAA